MCGECRGPPRILMLRSLDYHLFHMRPSLRKTWIACDMKLHVFSCTPLHLCCCDSPLMHLVRDLHVLSGGLLQD